MINKLKFSVYSKFPTILSFKLNCWKFFSFMKFNSNKRKIKKLQVLLDKINSLEIEKTGIIYKYHDIKNNIPDLINQINIFDKESDKILLDKINNILVLIENRILMIIIETDYLKYKYENLKNAIQKTDSITFQKF